MLKIISIKLAKLRKCGAGVGGDSRARRDRSEIDRSGIDNIQVDGDKVGDDKVGKKGQKTSKSKNLSKSKKMIGLDFPTLRAKLAFTELRQEFLKALIIYHFDPEYHILIEMDASCYAIDEVLSQLTLPVALFLQKIILAETRYETYDIELLAIVETFKC